MKFSHITKDDLEAMERIHRIHLINSLSGFKSANLIGTRNTTGQSNLAIFSSVIHLGSNPALLGFIMRPPSVERHTYENILETGCFTINQVHSKIIEKAHYTAVKLGRDESEFETCGLSEQILQEFAAPYVKESKLKIGLSLIQDVEIESNGTRLIVGAVEHIYLEESPQRANGSIDLRALNTVCLSGIDHYHSVEPGTAFPYPKRAEMPEIEVETKRPNAVAYDEETETYNAALLPYATSVSGPAFAMNDLSVWKNTSVGKVSAHFKTKFEEIKSEYKQMVDQYSWNEVVYSAKFNFEPVVGETYHLYTRENGDQFMSMIPPHSWKKKCLGSFQLNTDKMWMKLDSPEE